MSAAALSVVDPWVTRATRDPLARVVRPARRARPGAKVYRRRRAVAFVLAATAAFLVAGAVRMALVGSGGGALATSGSSGVGPGQAPPGRLYVVQPGDTLWSIVIAQGHRGDPRPEVDRLALELGDRPLQPGQRLLLP